MMSGNPLLPYLERVPQQARATRGQQKGEDRHWILFLHGLGCKKENFATPLSDDSFYPGLCLLAPDLPGHGEARNIAPNQSTMQAMAKHVVHLITQKHCQNLHIIAHSMGGAVGLLAIQHLLMEHPSMEHLPFMPLTFITLEGNLTSLDCGLLSGRTARIPRSLFVEEKFAKLQIRAARSEDSETRDFSTWLEDCNPEAFHKAACSLVAWSKSNHLLKWFGRMPNPLYLYGEKSGDRRNLALLHRQGIKTRQLENCGHFAFTQNPKIAHQFCANMIAHTIMP